MAVVSNSPCLYVVNENTTKTRAIICAAFLPRARGRVAGHGGRPGNF